MSLPPTDTKTVLVVDDDPSLRLVLSEVLAQEGYAVVQAPNGQVGLRLAEFLAPDVILLDLALPGKSGLDVLEELRGQQATRAIPVILMSAYAHLLRESDMRSAAGVCQKPFDLTDLLGQVQRAACKEK